MKPKRDDFRVLVHSPAQLAQSYVAWAERIQESEGCTWGVNAIDEKVIPIRAGEMGVILGRPGHGKSSALAYLALTEARRILARGKRESECVVFVTWEESAEELTKMFIPPAGYTITDLAWGRVPLDTIRQQASQLAQFPPVWIIGHGIERAREGKRAPDMTPEAVLSAIETMEADYGIKPTLALFDYIQRVPVRRISSKVEEVTEAVKAINDLGMRIGCPVYVGAQARQEVDRYDHKMPTASDCQWACLADDVEVRNPFTMQPVTIQEIWNTSNDGVCNLDVSCLDEKRLKIDAGNVALVKRNPNEQIYKVSCGNYGQIRTNSRHKFYTPTGWKELQELREGDWVAFSRVEMTPRCSQVSKGAAYIIGLLLGDGTLVRSLILSNKNKAVIASFREAVEQEWPGLTTSIRRQTKWECWDSTIIRKDGRVFPGGNQALNWFREIGLFGLTANEKHIPSLQMNTDATCAMLSGLFVTDGSVSFRNGRPQVTFSSCSKRLSSDVSYLLKRIGIFSTIGIQRSNDKQDIYNVRVSSIDLPLFVEKINMVGGKSDKLRNFFRKHPELKSNSIGDLLPPEWNMELIEAAREQHKREKCNTRIGRSVTRGKMKWIAEYLDDDKLRRYAFCDLAWHKIDSIEEDGVDHTFDVYVPGHENLIANGFVVHNSAILQDADKVFALLRPAQYLSPSQLGHELYQFSDGRSFIVNENLLILKMWKQRGDAGNHTWALFFEPETLALGEIETRI